MPAPVTVGVSLKMYFGHREAVDWCARVADRVRQHAAVSSGAVRLFVIPTYLQILPALEIFKGTPVLVGAQDVAADDVGPFTGEVSARELAEVGAVVAEIGHAERRRLFGETNEVTARKAAAAIRNGLTPTVCVGETERKGATDAAAATVAQLIASLDGTPAGAVIVAYEPVWAIGASEPAASSYIRIVTTALASAIHADSGRSGSAVIYGGAARPGLLTELGDAVDGLFLGRFAHDSDSLSTVLDEAATLSAGRRSTP